MSKYYDILMNISSLNDSDIHNSKKKTKKNIGVWERTLFELFLNIIRSEKKVILINKKNFLILKVLF